MKAALTDTWSPSFTHIYTSSLPYTHINTLKTEHGSFLDTLTIYTLYFWGTNLPSMCPRTEQRQHILQLGHSVQIWQTVKKQWVTCTGLLLQYVYIYNSYNLTICLKEIVQVNEIVRRQTILSGSCGVIDKKKQSPSWLGSHPGGSNRQDLDWPQPSELN